MMEAHYWVIPAGSDTTFHICPPMGMDFTGFSAKMQIRRHRTSEDVLDELSTDNERLCQCFKGFDVLFPHGVTEKWAFRNAVFDLKVIAPDGSEFRAAEGRIKVSPGVTR